MRCLGIGILILVVICVLLVKGCQEIAKTRTNTIEKNKFLSEFNPALKVLRDQLVAEISTLDGHVQRLENIRSSFSQEGSRAFVTQRIETLQVQRQNLKQQLDRIDVEAEKGVALREFNKMDGGGIASEENAKLAAGAQEALGEARRMTDALESELGGSKGASQSKPSTAQEQVALNVSQFEPARNESQATESDHSQEQVALSAPQAEPTSNETQATESDHQITAPRRARRAIPLFSSTFRVVGVQRFLSLRGQPSASARVIARIPANASGLRQCDAATTSDFQTWMPVEFGGVRGFVNARYLAPVRRPR